MGLRSMWIPSFLLAQMAIGAGGASGDKLSQKEVRALLDREIQRSKPDYVVYRPGSVDGTTRDTGNEHFLVFDGPDGSLMAVWTQSSYEGAGDHRIVFSRSDDEGLSWESPRFVAGCPRPGEGKQASWGFPLVSKSGRIYVVYSQYQGIHDLDPAMTGTMDCVYSDDMGKTWSEPATIPMERSPYDHPDAQYPSNWIVWQKPIRDQQGKWLTGFTRWVSPAVRTAPPEGSWMAWESVVEFMRFENIDDNPEPESVEVTYSAWGEEALRVPHYLDPRVSVVQEPSLVYLPDKRLMCVMRTMTGYIWYSLSSDDGATWANPRPLLRKDKGRPIMAPLCCTPLYPLSDGRYVLIHHNTNGRDGGKAPEDRHRHDRNPAWIAVAEYRPEAEQPLWFSESKILMDNEDIGIGPLNRQDIGVYPSMTNRDGKDVFWYCERKFFLLGRNITGELLSDLKVPD